MNISVHVDMSSPSADPENEPIFNETFFLYFKIYFTITFHGLVCVVSVVTNLLSMVIFYKLGLKNSMSVGLFAICLTDFLVTSIQLVKPSMYILDLVHPDTSGDVLPRRYFTLLFGWLRTMMYLISCWIMVFISLERCLCVVSPFRVREIFTRGRCVMAVVFIYVFHIALHFPVFLTQSIGWVDACTVNGNSCNNNTVSKDRTAVVQFSDHRADAEMLVDFVGGIALSVVSQTLVFIFTGWMIHALKSSSFIRQTPDYEGETAKKPGSTAKAKASQLSIQERKLLKVVLTLAIMLSICNVPRFIVTAVYNLVLDMGRRYDRTVSSIIWEISHFFNNLCCATSFLVYVTLNSSYRQTVREILPKCCQLPINRAPKQVDKSLESTVKSKALFIC